MLIALIKKNNGAHLWSMSFDRDLMGLFAVQDEIAREVVDALKASLLETEQQRMAPISQCCRLMQRLRD